MHTRTIIDPRYGAKLTGKAGKTTLGVMYANDEAPGYAEDAVAGAAGQTAQTFVGRVRYDDHYRQADHIMRDLDGNGIDDRIFQSTALKRTNRAVFVKLQYLFRY